MIYYRAGFLSVAWSRPSARLGRVWFLALKNWCQALKIIVEALKNECQALKTSRALKTHRGALKSWWQALKTQPKALKINNQALKTKNPREKVGLRRQYRKKCRHRTTTGLENEKIFDIQWDSL